MPFVPNTPESLLSRSDSKDPATTCKGLTTSGRPCRRPLSLSPQASPMSKRKSKNGVVAVLEAEDDEHDGAAAFFCWQHQDQAETLVSGKENDRRANIVPVHRRTSIDTLVDRLGVLDVEEDEAPSKNRREKQHVRVARKDTLPRKWQDMDGPLLAVNSGKRGTSEKNPSAYLPKERSNLGLFCCVRSVDRDPLPPPRTRKDPEKTGRIHHETSRLPTAHQSPGRYASRPDQGRETRPEATHSPTRSSVCHENRPGTHQVRPLSSQPRPSQTKDFLSLIPKTLPPQTTAFLLAELAKPISAHDEAGFIYMFWLTDASTNIPEAQAASSLLSDNLPSTPNGRRKSDFLQAHTTRGIPNSNSTPQPTILLKIGRASNVQRRMNEWTRQCGHNLSLIRFYPHSRSHSSQTSISTPPASPNAPSKVPHSHKVERLIHIELAEQRVKRECDNCGKEHREWFEVESSREGLKRVDGVVRRWTEWGMRVGRKGGV